MSGEDSTLVVAASDRRVTELDALRGLAALAVVLFHLTQRYHTMFTALPKMPFAVSWGEYGVQIFFAISGFVIFMTLNKARRASDFILSRLSRLFPAYWVCVLITFSVLHLIGPAALQVPGWVGLVNLSMVQSFLLVPSVDGVYWSLSVELAFYVCMLGLWQLRLLGRIETLLFGWISLKWLWWFLPGLSYFAGLLVIQDYIPFFALGILAYRVWASERQWLQQMPILTFSALSVFWIDPAPIFVVWCVTAALMMALASGRLVWLRMSPLVWLGGISYPLYLIHQNIGYAIMIRLDHAGFPIWLGFLVALTCAFTLAVLISTRVERPALIAIRQAWRTRGSILKPA
jgi:peptidoglycan/LPS O-acetylase OafA/YrhL